VTTSTPQPAGLVAIQNSTPLTANLPATVVCPAGHFAGTGAGAATNGTCRTTSYPELYNNVIWKNRTFNISVGGLGTGPLNQQNVVTLLPTLNQLSTGACVQSYPTTGYWTSVCAATPAHEPCLNRHPDPTYSVLTNVSAATGYSGATLHNTASDPRCCGSTATARGFRLRTAVWGTTCRRALRTQRCPTRSST